jgi:hypothetical protein
MQLNIKIYKAKRIKSYLKTHSFFLIMNGVHKSSISWIKTEQELQKFNFCYYKVLNKISIKKFYDSIYKKTLTILSGSTFFIKPGLTILTKHILLNSFKPLLLATLALKISSKLYSCNQLKNIHSVYYEKNKMLIFQFFTIHLKSYCLIKY